KGLKPVEDGILARGEATGHMHQVLISKSVKAFANSADPGQLFVEGEGQIVVSHQQHGRLELEPGIWQVNRQRELDLVGERLVQD
ncbi:MAG: hypothetical protein HYW70_02490, partial [Candidatus Nealsonbacteria bacterium]|nr:hypothetical protein [Candidatus Nealsonbacteria bacterium]